MSSNCIFCLKSVTKKSGGIQCDQCQKWTHYDCISANQNIPGLSTAIQSAAASLQEIPYSCPKCNPDVNLIQQFFQAKVFSFEKAVELGWQDYISTPTDDLISSGDHTSKSTSNVIAAGSTDISQILTLLMQQQVHQQQKEEKDRKERLEREERDRRERLEKEERYRNERMEKDERDRKEREEERKRTEERQDRLFQMLSQRNLEHNTYLQGPSQNSNTSSGQKSYVKLPKYELPTFSGDIKDWIPFWEAFQTAVHNNEAIPPEMKFFYLSGALKGTAATCIEGLQHTSQNYVIAINLLKQKFGRDTDILHRHILDLQNQPPMKSDGSNLEDFVQQQEIHLRRIESFGEGIHKVMFPILYSKLSTSMMLLFDRQMTQNEIETPSIDNLRSFLQNEVSYCIHQREFGSTTTVLQKNAVPSKSTASSVLVQQKLVSNVPANITCAFCDAQGQHYSFFCPNVIDAKERKTKLFEKKLCFICLHPRKLPEHRICPNPKPCRCCGSTRHHGSICFVREGENTTTNVCIPQNVNTSEDMNTVCTSADPELLSSENSESRVYILSVKGRIGAEKGKETVEVNVFLDTGSKNSYILSDMAEKLELPVVSQFSNISVAHFGSSQTVTYPSKRVSFFIKMESGSLRLSANTVSKITAPLSAEPMQLPKEILKERSIKNISTGVKSTYSIGLLIGADHFNELVFGVEFISKSLSLYHTVLGDLIFGRIGEIDNLPSTSVIASPALFSPTLVSSDELVTSLWNLESIGIRDNPHTSDDELALQQFKNTVELKNNRYFVNWPWRCLSTALPSNFILARERLKRFHQNKLLPTPNLLQKYNTTISEQLEKGIIEVVPDPEVKKPLFDVHYIPHHAVIKESSNTTKLRVVYDASAKSAKGTSLNQHLLRGPVILASLIGLLLRFRIWTFVLSSDIEKAFLQIGLHESQRDVCRFIWLKNPHLSYSQENQQIYRFCRVPFGVVSSPFLLGATIQHHLDCANTKLAKTIQENIYVDNVFFGAQTEEEAIELYTEAKNLFAQASMNLREWTSNSSKLSSYLPEVDKGMGSVKVLGLKWNTLDDCIELMDCTASTGLEATKRNLLHSLAKVFDPLGLFSPLVLPAKLLFQQLWTKKLDWDTALPDEFKENWDRAFTYINKINPQSIKRRLLSVTPSEVEIVCFTDASLQAYGACVYIKQGKEVALLCSKSRLSPLKPPSLPRLELLGVLIGVRMMKTVSKELHVPIISYHVFSDSQIVLNWITSSKQRTVFVENRLSEIRNESINFHYVQSENNPADLTTRGSSNLSSFWWRGPDWISQESRDWETWKLSEDNMIELRKVEMTLVNQHTVCHSPFDISAKEYSSFSKLLRVTALAHRFVHNCQHPENPRKPEEGVVEPQEVEKARKVWEHFAQRDGMPQIFKSSTALQPNDLVKELKLFLDSDGLVRSQGRLSFSNVQQESNCPILLPKNHLVTNLIISAAHVGQLHAGTEQTLSYLRLRYWILSGRTQVRNILNRCLNCRRAVGSSFRPPPMPPLPPSRVTSSPAFSKIGVDLMGPLYLKNERKVYVYIFVCMATRAVHLELVETKNTTEFLEAYLRFCSRRGIPCEIVSDNATNFRRARVELYRRSKQQEMIEAISYQLCFSTLPIWNFLPPMSPWMGGFYERLIGSLRQSLCKNLGRTLLNWNQLFTLIIAIEGILNTRPLTYLGSDIRDGRPITPADFIAPSTRLVELPDSNHNAMVEGNASDLISMWKRTQNLLNNFWKHWSRVYLLGLRSYNLQPSKSFRNHISRNPVSGEIVIVKDKAAVRANWKLGQITKLCVGKDGNVRSAFVRLSSGQELHRPITFLFPLEYSFSPGGSVTEYNECS